jgi:hypothetical protein
MLALGELLVETPENLVMFAESVCGYKAYYSQDND